MGRPTDYSENTVEQAKYYIENYTDEAIGDVVPSIEGLACFIGVSRETIYDWERQGREDGSDKEEFSDIIAQLRTKKSKELQNGGLSNKYNSKISGLLLGHEGYREKQDIDHTSNGESMNADTSKVKEIAEAVAKKLKDGNTNA